MTTSNKCQGTIHTCKVNYVSGTSERIKALSEEVIPVIGKPKGTVTRAELEAAFKKVHDLQFADPPLGAQEYIHRQSFVLALMNRAPETGMTPQELMNRSDVVAAAIGSMAFSGGGVGRPGGMGARAGGTGPVLPRTSSATGQIKPAQASAKGDGSGEAANAAKTVQHPVVGVAINALPVVRIGRWMTKAEYEAMKKTGKVQNGAGDATYGATSGPGSFGKQAAPGSVYVEYDVLAKNVIQGSKPDWVVTIGPNANTAQRALLARQGGEFSPAATNISGIIKTK